MKDTRRVFIAGSVDDGKSTLLGRLFLDTKKIYRNQMETLEKMSDEVNLAYLTDGLKSEIEQNITIDVAYRYLETKDCYFIFADAPGHVQYTRNMFVAASTADIGVILVDATKGVTEQTKRHIQITELLGIKRIIYAVNKMDLVEWDKKRFNDIEADLKRVTTAPAVWMWVTPVSAKYGDNVVSKTDIPGLNDYPSLLTLLESVKIHRPEFDIFTTMPVQCCITDNHGYRGYAGKISSGILKEGDVVTILPTNISATVKKMLIGEKCIKEAVKDTSVSIVFDGDYGIKRGDIITTNAEKLLSSNTITLKTCSFYDSLQRGKRYLLLHNTSECWCVIDNIGEKMRISGNEVNDNYLHINEIADVSLTLSENSIYCSIDICKALGSYVFVDPVTNNTVAAGVI